MHSHLVSSDLLCWASSKMNVLASSKMKSRGVWSVNNAMWATVTKRGGVESKYSNKQLCVELQRFSEQ